MPGVALSNAGVHRHMNPKNAAISLLAGLVFLASTASAADEPMAAIRSPLAPNGLMTDAALAGKRVVAVGERGHIVYSDDDGRSWQQAEVPARSLLTAVCFADATHGWAAGHDGTLLATVDAGASWQLQRRQLFDAQAYEDALDAGAGGDEDAALADDGGEWQDEESWEDEADGGMNAAVSRVGAPLLDVWCRDAQQVYAVGAYGLFLTTVDGGKTWEDGSDRLPNPDGWHVNALTALPGNADTLVLVGEKGTVYRSSDGGRSFSALRTPGEGSLFGVLAPRQDALFAFGLQGRLYRSNDVGRSWQAVDTGITSGINDGIVLPDGSLMLGGNAGVILRSDAGLQQWQTQRRTDRKAVMSAVPVEGGHVLATEGGMRRAGDDGQNR